MPDGKLTLRDWLDMLVALVFLALVIIGFAVIFNWVAQWFIVEVCK